ncbi:MAG TPA: hypothetical protein VE176_10275 [Candidatus Limnocylindrales bacterium]|jgi:hypothetical protein|nr:hypothetical protein [Candidatus Limnocylindrales bacterium]
MKQQTILRQGDVLLVRVDALPKGARDITEDGRIVLAEGEMTGHAHAVHEPLTKATPNGKARLWNAGDERYIQVLETTALRHEEHAAIPLEPGVYRVGLQREYSPDEIRSVAD